MGRGYHPTRPRWRSAGLCVKRVYFLVGDELQWVVTLGHATSDFYKLRHFQRILNRGDAVMRTIAIKT